MIRRIVGWFVLVPLCAALVVFALANRQLVVVNFNPFAPASEPGGIGVPLFLVLFLVLLVGVVLGGAATWFAQGRHRHNERHWRRHAEVLSRDLEAIRREPAGTGGAPLDLDDLVNRQ
jgi:uncharacterized integral membrane protein